MPEGDVVLLAARRLTRALADGPLVRGELRWAELGDRDLSGRSALGTASLGKHLLTRLEGGLTLHSHLRMDGSWRTEPTRTPPRRHGAATVRAVLATAASTAVGRSLGMLDLVRTADERTLVGHLGPDLLAAEPDHAEAARRARANPARPVGEVLLDQRPAAGIGTVFLAETLWALRVNPWTPVDETDIRRIYEAATILMRRSVEGTGPSSMGDAPAGRTTHVHGRAGRPCRRCGTPLRRDPVGAPPMERPGFWCPTCQART